MRQCDPHRIKGWFYFPESSAERRPGILTWQPGDGATLELIGGLSPEPEREQTPGGGWRAYELVGDVPTGTIYGESHTGQAVTIWDARRGRYSAGLTNGVHEEYWHSSWICVGAHIPAPHEAVATRAAVTIDELYYLTADGRFCAPQWARIEGVEHPGEEQPDGTLLTPYIFPVVGGYRAEYACADTADARYSIATTATRPWLSPATEAMPDLKLQMMTTNLRRGKVVKLQVGAHVSIQLPDNISGSAADFVAKIGPVDDLVQLATFEPCGVEQITLTMTDDATASLLVHDGKVAHPDDHHDSADVVFDLTDVPLDKYLRARERLSQGDQASYAWSVAVGLCGYSPRLVEEYVSQALAAAEGFHCWCLQGGEGVSLNARLRALHAGLDPEVQAALKLDVDRWARWAVWARNHVAHGGTRIWRPSLRDSVQLNVVAESVHLVTYLTALKELGVPAAKVRDALFSHPRLLMLTERCSGVNLLPLEPPSSADSGT